ncbi:MAG: CAP domain-containing protein [Deltaproteobacteria bacterium]|nr:CAP domain-containing protein [Deltaproteobacteria bacterium]
MLRGDARGERIEAPAPSVASYQTLSSDGGPVGPEEAAASVARGVEAAGRAAGVEILPDGRLSLLAGWTLEHLGDGATPPPQALVEFFARNLGLVEPVPHLLILGQPDAAGLEAGVQDSVRRFLERQAYDHYGVGVAERGGLTLTVVTLSRRPLDLEPVPRRVEPGAELQLSGRLHAGFAGPTFAVTAPDGSVQRLPAGEGPDFELSLPVPARGVHRVELLAQGPRGDSVLANFPVYVGVPVPHSITLAAGDDLGEHGDPDAVAAALLEEVQRTRREAGLPELTVDTALVRVARAHSVDMVQADFIGHRSPTTGTAPERVERAGIRTGLVLENIGRGYGAAEIHRGLLESPGHRANLLNPDVTAVGIAVVAEPEGERMAFIATELFIRAAERIDLAAAPGELLTALNRARRARHARPLRLDPNLAASAQTAAADYFAHPDLSQQDVVDDASGRMRRFAIAFSRVGGLMVVVSSLDEAATLEPALQGDVRYVGIGVSQGSRPDHPPNSIAVVILLGWPR